ncbi:MAG: monovalent cation/H+ antiporter subunit D family protein [Desulfobacteraceae bacterium]|nr:monovalent cation/H+ antiporter subunit D family protein [Desulfobacteraceae bacterium]
MQTIISIKPLLAVLVSLFVIPVLISSSGKPNVRESWIFVSGVIKFLIIFSMLPVILQGNQIVLTLFKISPGADIAFRVDALGMLFALVASSLYIITSIYSIGYMRGLNEHGQTRFVSFFALALTATIGAAFSANLLTLYLFYELLSLSTYPLVVHHQDAKSRASGRRYLTFILGTSIGLVLPAMIYCYHATGTLEFAPGGIFSGQLSKPSATVLLLMFVFGFAKSGIMPFHSWLPAAMVAPTPVSALLHAVAVVKVGVFSIIRVVTGIFGVDFLLSFNLGAWVATIASITIVVSSCIALTQDELKRRLAYSTIGQLSYIVLGVALLTPKGMTGGMLHIAMHAFGKITLFFCAGAIFVATGKKYISQMVGIGKAMPITMAAFFMGSLSIIGLPPTGGFISKWYLVLGTLEGDHMILLFVILTSSLLNAAYFMPIFYKAFFCTKEEAMFGAKIVEAPMMCVVPLVITALISFGLFFLPQPFLDLAGLAAKGFLGG